MKTEIIIHCETDKELYSHLKVIINQIKNTIEKNPDIKTIMVEDNNCYGYHSAEITGRK